MSSLEPMLDLIANKELALSVYSDIPENAIYMRMNKGWGMYYIYHGEEKQGGKFVNHPHRYMRHLNDWVALKSIQGTWDQFMAQNGVFSVSDFKLALVKEYPIEVLGEKRAWEIVDNNPATGSHYNFISGKYHRLGEGDCSEIWTGQHVGVRLWVDSAHSNDDFADLFIDIEDLTRKLESQPLFVNCSI